MSTNISFALFNTLKPTDSQIQAAITFNKNLNLKARSIRLLQSVLGVMVTGEWGKDDVIALMHPTFSQAFITREFIAFSQANPDKVASIGGISTTFNGIVSSLNKIAGTGFIKELKDKLGRLNEAILEGVIEEMRTKKQSNQALMIAADYFQQELGNNILQLSFQPSLNQTFLTKVAFSSQSAGPNGSISSAPHELLQVQIGELAFDNIQALKQVLQSALGVKPTNISPPRPFSSLSSDKKAAAVKRNSVRFAHEQSVRILQALVGAPVTGKLDETTVDGIAQFQQRSGLGVDGIVGKGQTLPAMIKKALDAGLYQAVVHLVAGYFNMNVAPLTYVFEHFEQAVEEFGFQTNVPSALFMHTSAKLKTMEVDDYLPALCPWLNSIMLYKGSNFTGPNSARIDVAFLPSIERINFLAGQHGVKIFVSGPNAASFRPEGTVVSGAIVTPSKRSNHKIGHAIDMNLIAGSTHLNSKVLHPDNEATWPSEVKNFINAIRQDPELRWGGDFNTADPVHLDDELNIRDKDLYDQRFIATQNAFPFFGDGTRGVGGEDEIACNN